MDRYIGLDVHANSCTVAIVGPSGRRLGSQVVETNGAALIEAIRAVPRPRHVCLEEGTQSGWLYEVLSAHADELVVTQAQRRSDGQKSDKRDAFALADALRLGSYDCRVFKAPHRYSKLRALAHTYEMIRGDVARTKNRIKAVYRSRGVRVAGKRVYGPNRNEWLKQLPSPNQAALELLYCELDQLVELKKVASRKLIAESRIHAITRLLESSPGFGPIRVARMIPTVVTPHRFRTSRQFWSYCGLGIVMRTSADWQRPGGKWVFAPTKKTIGLNPRCNRTLKGLFKAAAVTVTKKADHPLTKQYKRLLDAGTKPPNAKLTIARKIAAITLAIWKHEEAYDPARSESKK
jgi:transposase